MKHFLRIALSLGLSGVFVAVAVRDVSWPEAWAALRSAHLGYVAPVILFGGVSLYFRALRWGVLLAPIADVPSRSLFSATSIGFTANMLLPLRAGEILKPWFLARKERLPLAPLLATVALERLFDMATLLFFFAAATLTMPLPPEWKRYGWIFLATFVVFLSLVVALQRSPERFLAGLVVVLRPFPQTVSDRVIGAARQFAAGLASLRRPSAVGLAVAHSLGVWVMLAASFGFGLSALDLAVPWVRGALALTTFVAIAVSIPGGPGFIGMFQVGCIVALEVYGVSRSAAFSYSVFVHVLQFATTVGLGLFFFLRENLSLNEIREIRAEAESDSARRSLGD
ncbi:MAG: lysylphosphatidylglycerol synthase transmembrane domain-containing protein [Candidatus Binatia bacterium]